MFPDRAEDQDRVRQAGEAGPRDEVRGVLRGGAAHTLVIVYVHMLTKLRFKGQFG